MSNDWNRKHSMGVTERCLSVPDCQSQRIVGYELAQSQGVWLRQFERDVEFHLWLEFHTCSQTHRAVRITLLSRLVLCHLSV
jgi:hypothetical protein